jgi:hypothetical protein
MRPAWLIEAGVYGDEATPLLREVRRQGMVAEVGPNRVWQQNGTTGRLLVRLGVASRRGR